MSCSGDSRTVRPSLKKMPLLGELCFTVSQCLLLVLSPLLLSIFPQHSSGILVNIPLILSPLTLSPSSIEIHVWDRGKKRVCSLYNLPAFHANVDWTAGNRARNQTITVSVIWSKISLSCWMLHHKTVLIFCSPNNKASERLNFLYEVQERISSALEGCPAF